MSGQRASACAVTVILLSSGDLDALDRSLDALSRQDLPAAYDIVVVDEGHEEATARLVGAWSARLSSHPAGHAVALRYLAIKAGAASGGHAGSVANPAAALNAGWRAASSPLLAFTQIDTVAARDWLRKGLAAFAGAGTGGGVPAVPSGATVPKHGVCEPARAEAGPPEAEAETEAIFGRVDCRLPKHPSEVQLQAHARDTAEFAAGNWFIRRRTLERLGGFDERFGDAGDETADLICRLLAVGVPWAQAPDVLVCRPVGPASWGASLRETRRLGSEALLRRRHPQLYPQLCRQPVSQQAPPLAPYPAPPVWYDLAVVAALLLASLGLWKHQEILAVAAGGCWLVLTAMLCIGRLRDTARTPAHVAEVLLTSPLLPILALYWRLVGTLRYRSRFAPP